ncbi:DUF7455 domain-containing protein [Actinomyces minihominis]|uniref:DUF7455 domain-containing protein n=1 Tax=Actinomyces minihominis TaxID=2002838 RepID=UPI001A91EB0B|nr:hypothetical protein [Actinomyces minihominis]
MNATTINPIIPDLLPNLSKRELDATDRCDSCGARAWVRAVLPASELLFCAHHANQHLDALEGVALFLQDDRDQMDS